MKTVEDAVRQENGVWSRDEFNAMAWVYESIDYLRLDGNGALHYSPAGRLSDPVSSDWQLVCTRAEFEAKAKELGYGIDDDLEYDRLNCLDDETTVRSSVAESSQSVALQQDPTALLLAYLQGQADAGIESAQMALDFYRSLNSKGA